MGFQKWFGRSDLRSSERVSRILKLLLDIEDKLSPAANNGYVHKRNGGSIFVLAAVQ